MFPTTLASVAQLVVAALQQRGIDGEALMNQIDMDPASMRDPNARYPFSAMTRLWLAAERISEDCTIGLQVARQFHPASLHGIGFAWLASDTLADAFQRLARYYRVATTTGSASIEHDADVYRFAVEPAVSAPRVAPAATDAAAMMIVRMCRMSAGEQFRPARVALPRPRPDRRCADQMVQAFRAQLAFDAPRFEFEIDAGWAERRLPTGNAELAHANEQVLIEYLAHLDRTSVGARVKARLVDALPGGSVSATDIARDLHLSPRSLQRRLKEEQTTYKALLDETRGELALSYLGNSRLSVNEVTYLLGFSDPSNFSRAFKRWNGISPGQYREKRLGAACRHC